MWGSCSSSGCILSEGYRWIFLIKFSWKNTFFFGTLPPSEFFYNFFAQFFYMRDSSHILCATFMILCWIFLLFLSSLHKLKLPKAYAKKKLNTMKAFDHSISYENEKRRRRWKICNHVKMSRMTESIKVKEEIAFHHKPRFHRQNSKGEKKSQ